MTSWHVSRGGKLRGPFSEPEMFELIGKRKLAAGDLVDADKAGNWWPIESVPTFAASFAPPAPVVHHYAPSVPSLVYLPDSVCRRCGADGRKVSKSRLTSSGSFWFVILLFVCLPVALIVLFVARERYTVCQSCGSQG